MSAEKNSHLFNAGFAIAVALVLSAIIGAWALVRVKSSDQTIVVTGSARKRIKSDLIIWRASVSYQASELSAAYRAVSDAIPRVKQYLIGKGITEDQITISSITTQTLRGRDSDGNETGTILGYSLKQVLEIRSNDVDLVGQISRQATELINQGILLESMPPEYHYTKLGDLKVAMLAEAAKDAKVRAEQIAGATGSSIGSIRSARMGVMQITAADSNEVSDYGINDTSTVEKDITAVVNVSFAVS